jgi:hypothetical protein
MDVESAALHELGHCFGLAHSASESAVMWEELDPEEVKRSLTTDDRNGMMAIYGLEIDDPNGSETWYINTSYDIHWFHDNPDEYVDILLNRYYPSSGTWLAIYSNILNDGTQSWTPTGTPSSTCRIRVRSHDYHFLYDNSDANFTVGGYEVIYPSAPGIYWISGEYRTILWSSVGITGNVNIKINDSYPNGDWHNVVSGTSDDGSYTWLVGAYTSNYCRIKIENANTPSNYDISKNNFSIHESDGLAGRFLSEINPNPFNSSTRIHYQIPAATRVTLTIYDVTGRRVTVLEDRNMDSGEHETIWDASNMPSGVYFLHMNTKDFQDTKKLLLLK